jgi:hypothetical protein
MAIFTLESLVLRGVSVLCDGRAVELCRGASETALQMPEVRISMRHPSPGNPHSNPYSNAVRPIHADVKRGADKAAIGAGRSRCRPGVLSRRSPALTGGTTAPSEWSSPVRPLAGVANISRLQAWCWQQKRQWSLDQLQPQTSRLSFTGATTFTGATARASTQGTGV